MTELAAVILEKLIDFLKDEVLMILGVKEKLEEMNGMMQKITNVLKDVEKESLFDATRRQQVRELKDIFYDIDDVIDDCKLKAQQRQSSSQLITFSSRVKNMKFSCKIAKRAKKINEKMEKIANQNGRLHATIAPYVRDQQQKQSSNEDTNWKTTHFINDDIVGDVEKVAQNLLKSMIEKKEHARSICVNLAIVGMGGIGKTTLAQKIFNNVKTQSGSFQKKIWICVSKDYKKKDLLKEIIRGVGGDSKKKESLEELATFLSGVVKDKKIFLVLDDVWNADIWCELLKNPLKHCKEGSKILITSRDNNVPKTMSCSHLHEVELLTVEQGWSMLIKNVLSEEGKENDIIDLQDVGIEIVKKCDRLPLAIKTVAGLLKRKEKRKIEWEKILDSEVWSQKFNEDAVVMKVLSLSYEDLPSQVKQCFVYCCSLFPEDYVFTRQKIAAMWFAEGFLGSNATLDSAIDAYRELADRNLLQQEDYNNRHKIHDTLRNFGQIVDNDENFFGKCNALDKRVRRLSIVDETSLEARDSQIFHEKLRTLMLFRSPGVKRIPKGVFEKLGHLRVLSLSCTSIDVLPDSIKYLKHLKFLDLSGTDIRMIPESTGDLRSLQFLNLLECNGLERLPNTIVNLRNLIGLGHPGKTVTHSPRGLGRLTKLQHLTFKVAEEGTELGCRLQELQNLKALRTLLIHNLHSNLSLEEVRSVDLKNMNHLRNFNLRFSKEEDGNGEQINKITDVLEELYTPPNLQWLWINDFYGHSFPSWMSPTNGISLENLVHLIIQGCGYCQQLPQLGKLPHLKTLQISGASRIQKIGLEFLGRGRTRSDDYCFHPFPKLESLYLKHFPGLEEWCWDGADDDAVPFPRLQILDLENCPRLRRLPELPTVQTLIIINCSSLEHVGNIPNASIREVFWKDEELEALPSWFEYFASAASSSMERLDIRTKQLHLLRRLCPWDIGSDWQLIRSIPEVQAYYDEDVAGEEVKGYLSKSPFEIRAELPGQGEWCCENPVEVDVGGKDESSSQGLGGNQADPSSSSSH